jgi:hypothetical protein
MLHSSTRFDDSVITSHDVTTRAEIVDTTGTYVIRTLDVIGGSVSTDAGRKVRRQCSLTLQDPTGELVPDTAQSLLQPYSGNFIKLYRGISWRDYDEEIFPLGTFMPYTPRISDKGDSLEISLDGYDRSKIITRARWTQPYVIAAGTNTAIAIRNLLNDRMPGLRYNLAPTSATVPLTVLGTETENDPWQDATDIAEADGMELFFDANDVVVLRDIPDPSSDPIIATFADDENCTVTEFNRENDASQMYTGVIVYSEGTGVAAPIRVEVWRTDTTLRIPYFFPTSLITDTAQAIATGESILRRVGYAEFSVQISAIPDPRFEAGDIVRIKRSLSKLDDAFMINSIDLPLDATSPMSISTAQRRMT